MLEVRNAYETVIRKSEGKRPLCRWEDNIEMDFKVICELIHVTKDRVQWWAIVNTVVNLCIP
jgi:hypothetical protein